MDTTELSAEGAERYCDLLGNMYGEHEHYQHIKRDRLQEYRRNSIRNMVLAPASLSVISDDGYACLIGNCVYPWYDDRPVAIENVLYVHPEQRTYRNAVGIINDWVDKGESLGIKEFHAGSLIGYRTEAVIKLYARCGFVKQGLTLIRKL